MDLCPGTLEQECGRPLKSGEDLCPSCRSQKRRTRARRVLMGPLAETITLIETLVKLKHVEKSIRNKIRNHKRDH